MGKRQRDCVGLRRAGRLSSAGSYCCRCMRRSRERGGQGAVPGLRSGPGAAGRHGPVRAVFAAVPRMRRSRSVSRGRSSVPACRRERAEPPAAKSPCPRCGEPGFLRGGDRLVRASVHAQATARIRPASARAAVELRRHAGLRHVLGDAGSATRTGRSCAARTWSPGSPNRRTGSATSSPISPPGTAPPGPAAMITTLGGLLADEHPNHPQAVLERARRPGRSMGRWPGLWRTSSPTVGLAMPTDQAERLAAGRRQTPDRRRSPADLRAGCRRASPASCCRPGNVPDGPGPARALTTPSRQRWRPSATWLGSWILNAASTTGHSSTCRTSRRSSPSAQGPRARRLTVLRPVLPIRPHPQRGARRPDARAVGQATPRVSRPDPPVDQQRDLFRRWTADPDGAPARGAGRASSPCCTAPPAPRSDCLRCQRHRRQRTASIRLGERPHPVPLDPASWAALQRCLDHRARPAHRQPARHRHPRRPKPTAARHRRPTSATCSTRAASRPRCCAAPDWSTWSTPWTPNSSPQHSG